MLEEHLSTFCCLEFYGILNEIFKVPDKLKEFKKHKDLFSNHPWEWFHDLEAVTAGPEHPLPATHHPRATTALQLC